VTTRLAGARLEEVRLVHAGEGAGFFRDEPALRAALIEVAPRLCRLCSPNNPTGAAPPTALIAALAADFPATLLVLDEAYCDLPPESQWSPGLLAAGNLLILRSMTKYGASLVCVWAMRSPRQRRPRRCAPRLHPEASTPAPRQPASLPSRGAPCSRRAAWCGTVRRSDRPSTCA